LADMSAVQGNAKVTALKDLKGEVRLGPAFVLVMHGTAYHTQYTYCNTVRFLAEPPRPHAEVLCMKDYHASGLAACPFTCRVLALHSKQHELWHLHSRCGLSDECITMWGLQALLTTRKGKKRFAMYDLTVTLTWQGLWVEDDKKQVCNVSLIDWISDTLSQGYTDLQTVCTSPMSYHLAPCMLTQVEYLLHFA